MRHLFSAFLFLLAGPAFANPCGTADLFETLTPEESVAIEDALASTPYAEGILWQATKGDSDVTVVGTLHIPDPRLGPIAGRVTDRLFAADRLILEATAEDEAGVQALAATEPELFFLKEGPSLLEMLGPEDWTIAAQRFEAMGIPGFFAAKFRPWYAGMVLSLPPCVAELALGDGLGLDRRLELMAESASVEVVAIEDARETLGILMGDNDAEDLEMLRLTLRSEMSGADATATTIEAYFEGRAMELWHLARILAEREAPGQGGAMFDEFSEALLHGRNRAWEADLPDMIAGDDVVIAVGAAHLPGETGVLRALERIGYEITPLP